MNVKFIKAERTSPNNIDVHYELDGEKVVLEWTNLNQNTFSNTLELVGYYIGSVVSADSEALKERLEETIKNGMTDHDDQALFEQLAETEFDSYQAEEEPHTVEMELSDLSYDVHSECYTAEATVDGKVVGVYLQLPDGPDSQHSSDDDTIPQEAIQAIADMADELLNDTCKVSVFVSRCVTGGVVEQLEEGVDYIYLGNEKTHIAIWQLHLGEAYLVREDDGLVFIDIKHGFNTLVTIDYLTGEASLPSEIAAYVMKLGWEFTKAFDESAITPDYADKTDCEIYLNEATNLELTFEKGLFGACYAPDCSINKFTSPCGKIVLASLDAGHNSNYHVDYHVFNSKEEYRQWFEGQLDNYGKAKHLHHGDISLAHRAAVNLGWIEPPQQAD